jgi:hypothetical protein
VKRVAWMLALTSLIGIAVAGLLSTPPDEGPTVTSRRAGGLRALFRYLELRGHAPVAWERPLSELPLAPGVLVLIEPLRVPFTSTDADALRRWLLVGGDVVLLPSGGLPGAFEAPLHLALELDVAAEEVEPPDSLGAALTFAETVHEATPDPSSPWVLTAPLRYPRGGAQVVPTVGARGLFRGPEGDPVVQLRRLHRGTVLVLPSAGPWTNGYLQEAGNLALLDVAMAELDTRRGLYFDAWHQGQQARSPEAVEATALPFDLLMGHLGLIYAALLWSVGRRFGPLRPESPAHRGSVDRDLRLLGSLHQQSGHAREAGALLLKLARQLGRRGGEAQALPTTFEGGEAELLATARQVGELQRAHRL